MGDAHPTEVSLVTPLRGVTRKDANLHGFKLPVHSREGGNPWDLPKSWTKGTGLLKQQVAFIVFAGQADGEQVLKDKLQKGN